MVQKLLEEEAFLLDTPFLRRIREESRYEDWREGRDEGFLKGQLAANREKIVDALVFRFNPPSLVSRQIEKQLRLVTKLDILDDLFALAIQGDTLEVFLTKLKEIIRSQSVKDLHLPGE